METGGLNLLEELYIMRVSAQLPPGIGEHI